MPATRCSPLVAPWYLMYSRSLWCRLSMVFPSPSDSVPANWSTNTVRTGTGAGRAGAAQTNLSGRVGHAVGHVADESSHVAVLDQLGHALGDVIEEAHGVSQEVHGAQDLSGLADQLL